MEQMSRVSGRIRAQVDYSLQENVWSLDMQTGAFISKNLCTNLVLFIIKQVMRGFKSRFACISTIMYLLLVL